MSENILNDKNVVLIDGGLSTELIELGYDLGNEYKRLWTAKWLVRDMNVMKQAHINFLKSGCDIITTSSYQLSVDLLMSEIVNCSLEEAREIIKKSVYVANDARVELGKNAIIAGSIGSYGACQCDCSEYNGSYAKTLSFEFLKEWHRPRLECLIEAKCDILAIETIPSIKEASAILDLLSEYPNIKAWLAFSCKDEKSICNGDSFAEAYKMFNQNKQLIAIGVNCSAPSVISGLLKSVDFRHDLPFVVYPNLGSSWNGSEWSPASEAQNLDNLFIEWMNLGAKYIGGCCNFSSKYMKHIRDLIDLSRKK